LTNFEEMLETLSNQPLSLPSHTHIVNPTPYFADGGGLITLSVFHQSTTL
jgi:hypothetical protein